jgi:hypothetical protein
VDRRVSESDGNYFCLHLSASTAFAEEKRHSQKNGVRKISDLLGAVNAKQCLAKKPNSPNFQLV